MSLGAAEGFQRPVMTASPSHFFLESRNFKLFQVSVFQRLGKFNLELHISVIVIRNHKSNLYTRKFILICIGVIHIKSVAISHSTSISYFSNSKRLVRKYLSIYLYCSKIRQASFLCTSTWVRDNEPGYRDGDTEPKLIFHWGLSR